MVSKQLITGRPVYYASRCPIKRQFYKLYTHYTTPKPQRKQRQNAVLIRKVIAGA
jgi:hypothetical protein